ncbi:MAG: glycerophosphoryl diester phosphodiesterase membrane domain-containing protein [Actinomycetaceae bacterium]|nr:glycerophosphoryl diester phosphodiesterase membrane domain-containing protein [Arcanobacterium sp.]MDD7505162.1 glycerophosphoryl diester phosphodiesterase membrane domain-containing protein [Actinomycetaceae bacterium]MDY6143848.1 glycerophosphoryl diester phosphodiesterase membrane domain-containing protein [Arcanobacterium sp.]
MTSETNPYDPNTPNQRGSASQGEASNKGSTGNPYQPNPYQSNPYQPQGTSPLASSNEYGAQPPSQYGAPHPQASYFNSGWKTVIPMRPLTAMETLESTVRLLKFNPKSLILFPMIVTIIASVISSIALGLFNESSTASASFDSLSAAFGTSGTGLVIYVVVEFLASVLTTVVAARVVVASVRGKKMDLGDAFAAAKPNFWRIFLRLLVLYVLLMVIFTAYTVLIVTVVAASFGSDLFNQIDILMLDPNAPVDDLGQIGLFLVALFAILIVSGIIALALYARLLLSPTAIVVENLGAFKSLARSWRLTKGSFWHIVGLLLLMTLIVSAVLTAFSFVIGIVVGLVTAGIVAGAEPTNPLFTAIPVMFSILLSSAVVVPFVTTLGNLVYVNMRFKRENLHLQLLDGNSN